MPHALAMCFCLMLALFSLAMVGGTYSQMKARNPDDDAMIKFYAETHERFGFQVLVDLQRSKSVRVAMFWLSVLIHIAALSGSVWFGMLTFSQG